MKNVDLESRTGQSVRRHLKSARTNNPKQASRGRRQPDAWDAHRASAVGMSFRPAANLESLDFSLIRDVQMRATGANIHAIAQQLQIYVNAIECGAMFHALAVESQLRAFLASGR